MNDSTRYAVVLDLSTTGSLDIGLQRVGERAALADRSVKGLAESARHTTETVGSAAERVGGFLEGAADKVTSLALGFGKVAALGTVAAATYGVMGLNNELEQTQISLGAIAQAQGFTKTFEGGFRAAGDQLAKMKQDVKTLPGDLGQLSNIMKMIAPAAAAGGASLDDIRKLSGRTMLTAGILSVPQDVASRETAGLLGGRAGSHNILGGRLGLVGDEAKKFNALSPEMRLAKLNEELNKYQGAADKFGNSFIANWTTLKDNVKYTLLGPSTSPLFDHVKSTMVEINSYFDTHKAQVEELTHTVGERLAQGWDTIVRDAHALEPIVARVASYLENLSPSDALEKIKHGGELVLAAKIGGIGLQTAGAMLPAAAKIGTGLARWQLGTGGAVAGAAEGAAAEGAAAEMSGLTTALVDVGGALAGATLAFGAVGAAALVAGGELTALADKNSAYHKDAVLASDHLGHALQRLAEDFQPAESAVSHFAQHVGTTVTDFVATVIDAFRHPFGEWSDLYSNQHLPVHGPDRSGYLPDDDPSQKLMNGLLRIGEGGGFKYDQDAAKKRSDAAQKASGIHVHGNIQINVEGAGDPSRVARLVMSEFHKLSRNPTKSAGTPDYAEAK